MNEEERAYFTRQLNAGNRALAALGTIDILERNTLTSVVVLEGADVYRRLRPFKMDSSLSSQECSGLQRLLDRLRAHLRYFGEDI